MAQLARDFRPSGPIRNHDVEVVFVASTCAELPGNLQPTSDKKSTWELACESRMGPSASAQWHVSIDEGLSSIEPDNHDLCWFVIITNPTLEDVQTVLKFACSVTFFIGAQVMVVCSLDVDIEFHKPFLESLSNGPSNGAQLFDEALTACFGFQSCQVGVGLDHLISTRNGSVACDNTQDDAEIDQATTVTEVVFEDALLLVADPPLTIDANEAASIAAELWASNVARLATAARSVPNDDLFHNKLCLLTFSRHPEQLDTLILKSNLARSMMAEGVHVKPQWANGAKVLTGFLAAGDLDIELCPRHVVLDVKDVKSLLDLLESLPYNVRPRLKPGCSIFLRRHPYCKT